MNNALCADKVPLQSSLDLLRWLGNGLTPAGEIPAVADWGSVLAAATATKTIGLLGRVAGDPAAGVPAIVAEQIVSARRDILLTNLRNFDWTIKTVNALQAGGIDPIVFKGALRSHHVYATWDARRSSDIDLLVRPEEYCHAQQILAADGMIALVSDTSIWWHRCLGESPYARPDSTSPIVDLHHRVQQPGGPYPRQMEEFFAASMVQNIGSNAIRTLSPHHALLVCAINYGKAVRARKPWLAEMHEFAWMTRSMTRDELTAVRNLAGRNNLQGLVDECLAVSKLLFASSGEASADFERAALSSIGHPASVRFERTSKLWHWMDGNLLRRGGLFTIALSRIARAELALRREGLSLPK
ncbi:nucleotidyltransferase family protein [Sphingomonas qomolangmaensis]|uniref:Nucleotidyltransferase family protein n=1 Tax=Sphingomonas qomolangmaensis TaxID=2918765 RepID=A0ABY5L6H2_9SPHN|nr:nucleotidyltransferase family protein [Sphingomonas qomolangmaensis]UUL82377.1 nucleotidyltransferase family protein [Sphingomonas qomolangmaensis]